MIEYPRASKNRPPNIRIIGLGGAGSRVLERLIHEHLEGVGFVAMNTDEQDLSASRAPSKVQLGTQGTGAGGDPDAGYDAADESASIIRESLEGSDLIFLCAGLGGGTGSGGAPLISNIARQCGAVVVALVSLPFGFEGKRRQQQADTALKQIGQQAQLVICFENDKMRDLVEPTAPAHEAFALTDGILCQAIRSLVSIVTGRGLLQVGLDELATVLHRKDARCLFGHGESDSESRAVDALERALRSPLMNLGQMFAEARDVIVHVAAGPEITVPEVSMLMEQVQRHVGEHVRLHLGVSADARMGRRLSVTIISATGSDPAEPIRKPERKAERKIPVAAATRQDEEFEGEPEPELFRELSEPEALEAAQAAKKEKVEQMQFEPVNRGRFEKSEPTIVDGQDLDIPTFLRKGLRLK